MSDIGSSLPVPIKPAVETIMMKKKWVQARKQERISQIAHLKQSIDDLLKGKIPEIERQILHAEQELAQLVEHEKLLESAIDSEEIK